MSPSTRGFSIVVDDKFRKDTKCDTCGEPLLTHPFRIDVVQEFAGVKVLEARASNGVALLYGHIKCLNPS
jgi:hypothetical protein